VAQKLVSVVAHFFVSVSGSKIHERVAQIFVDVYNLMYLSVEHVLWRNLCPDLFTIELWIVIQGPGRKLIP